MSRRIQWTTGPHQRLARSYSAKTRKTALLKFKFLLMKCSQFTTAVSLCLRRTKFTTMRNFSLARVFSFLSSPSPSPTVLLSLVWTVSLSFFSRFSSAFSLDATRCKVSPLYSKLGFKPGSTSSCISTLSVFNSFILEHRI